MQFLPFLLASLVSIRSFIYQLGTKNNFKSFSRRRFYLVYLYLIRKENIELNRVWNILYTMTRYTIFFLFIFIYLTHQQGNNSNFLSCSFGFFRTQRNKCVECLSTCPRCQDLEDKCESCAQGFRPNVNKTECQACGRGQLSCTINISCQRYYRAQGATCRPLCIVRNCADCSSIITTTCNRCSSGFRLTSQNKQCIQTFQRISNSGRNLQQQNDVAKTQDIFTRFGIRLDQPPQNLQTDLPPMLVANDIINQVKNNVNPLQLLPSPPPFNPSLSQFGLNPSSASSSGINSNTNIGLNGISNFPAQTSFTGFNSSATSTSGALNLNVNNPTRIISQTSTQSFSTQTIPIQSGSNMNINSNNMNTNSNNLNTNSNNFGATGFNSVPSSSSFTNNINNLNTQSQSSGSGSTANTQSSFSGTSFTSQSGLATQPGSTTQDFFRPQMSFTPQSSQTTFTTTNNQNSFQNINGGMSSGSSQGLISNTASMLNTNGNINTNAQNFGQGINDPTRTISSSIQIINSTQIPGVVIATNTTTIRTIQNRTQITSGQILPVTPIPLTPIVTNPIVTPVIPITPIITPNIPINPVGPNVPIVPMDRLTNNTSTQRVVLNESDCLLNQYLSPDGCKRCSERCMTCINEPTQCLQCNQRYVKRGWKCINSQFVPFNVTLKVPAAQRSYALSDGIQQFKESFIKFILPSSYSGSSTDVITIDQLVYNQSRQQLFVSGVVQKMGSNLALINNSITTNLVSPPTSFWPYGVVVPGSATAINSTVVDPGNSTTVLPGSTVVSTETNPARVENINLAAILIPSILGGLCLIGICVGVLCCCMRKMLCFKDNNQVSERQIPKDVIIINQPPQATAAPLIAQPNNLISSVPFTSPTITLPVSVPGIVSHTEANNTLSNMSLKNKVEGREGQINTIITSSEKRRQQTNIHEVNGNKLTSIDNFGSVRQAYLANNTRDTQNLNAAPAPNPTSSKVQTITVYDSNKNNIYQTVASLPSVPVITTVVTNNTSQMRPTNDLAISGVSNVRGPGNVKADLLLQSKVDGNFMRPKSVVKVTKMEKQTKEIIGDENTKTIVLEQTPVKINTYTAEYSSASPNNVQVYNVPGGSNIRYITSQNTINSPTITSGQHIVLNETRSISPTTRNIIQQTRIVNPGAQVINARMNQPTSFNSYQNAQYTTTTTQNYNTTATRY